MRSGLRYLPFLFAMLSPPGSSAHAELRVAATIKPIHSLVAGVMAGVGRPHLIVSGAASPHTYALKPSNAAALQTADLIFQVGNSFEHFLKASLRNSKPSATVISLSEIADLRRLPYRKGEAWSATTHHLHDHSSQPGRNIDPHIWLDPKNAIAIVTAVAQQLAAADPVRRDDYARNAAAMTARLKDLNANLQMTVAPVRDQPFLVFHDSFQYFETAYGVTAIGAVSLGEARTPGVRRIRALKRDIERRKVICLFTEPQFEPRIVAALVQGTAVRSGVLDPVGADIEPGPEAYFKLMRRNAKALADCLK
jgi:zinc transport system substrate-binding protein